MTTWPDIHRGKKNAQMNVKYGVSVKVNKDSMNTLYEVMSVGLTDLPFFAVFWQNTGYTNKLPAYCRVLANYNASLVMFTVVFTTLLRISCYLKYVYC